MSFPSTFDRFDLRSTHHLTANALSPNPTSVKHTSPIHTQVRSNVHFIYIYIYLYKYLYIYLYKYLYIYLYNYLIFYLIFLIIHYLFKLCSWMFKGINV